MPAYDYELFDPKSGTVIATVTLIRPVLKRDAVKLRRKTVPGRVTISGAAQDPFAPDHTVMRGYHRQEEKLGSRFKSQYSADQVKDSFHVKPNPLPSDS